MSLTVTQRPDQHGVWVTAKNPVLYKMTRKDYAWTLLVTSAGNTSIRIATDVTASFVAGDIIWLEADDGAYSAAGTVVSSAYGTYTTVVTTVPYVANNAAGYINTITKRANYYVGVDVYDSSDNSFIGTVEYYPNKKGLLTIDVSQPLQSVFDPSINAISDGVIYQDTNITIGYYIKYTEFWTGSGNSATDDSGSANLHAIYGARQIGDPYGGYYQDYISVTATKYPLSKLDSMIIALGEYFTLTYISEVGGTLDWMKKNWYDASGTLLCITYIKNTNNTTAYAGTSIPISVYTLFQKLAFKESITPDRNITNGGTETWSSNSLLIGIFQFSNNTFQSALTPWINDTNAYNLPWTWISNGVINVTDISFPTSILFTQHSFPIGTYTIRISGTNNSTGSSPTGKINIFGSNDDFATSPDFLTGDTGYPIAVGAFTRDYNFTTVSTYSSFGFNYDSDTFTTTLDIDINSVSLVISPISVISKSWSSPLVIPIGKSLSLEYNFTLTGNSTNVTVQIHIFDINGNVLISNNLFTGSNGTYSGTYTLTNSSGSDSYFIGFSFANNSQANKTLTLNSLIVNLISTPKKIDFKAIRLSSSTSYSETSSLTNSITANILECVKNQITLMWRNSLGGESSWTFNYSQDLLQKMQDPYKNKWITFYDNNLTLAQYNALNELFTLGQIYQTPIIELTTSVDKTEARIGQQVYIVDSSGNKTGVIVIPTENKTMTKRNKHNFQGTIQLPEIFG